jgi:hypothetical protein
MAGPLDAVPKEDRSDFKARLATFGLDPMSLLAQDLIAVPSAVTTLSTHPDAASSFQPVVLRTSDFDVLSRWIGIPDEVFDKVSPVVEPPRATRLERVGRGGQGDEPAEAVTSDELATIRTAARAYLRGDSRQLAHFKPLFKRVFPTIDVAVWPFVKVVVKSGSVLEFGPGPHVLVAHSVTIQEGGLIRSYGDLTVTATIVKKETGRPVVALDDALRVGRRFGRARFEH